MAESILVAFETVDGKDKDILIIGKKHPNKPTEVINAFMGEEAIELWNRLTIKKDEKNG